MDNNVDPVRTFRTFLPTSGDYDPARELEIYQHYRNPTFQDNVDGITNPNGSTYGSYQTLSNDNPTRSVSTISPSKADFPQGKTNPAFIHDSSLGTDNGVHVYPERNGHYVQKNSRPNSTSPAQSSRPQYSPSEDREVPAYYMPVNAHRKLLRGEILYVTKDTRNQGAKCWRRTICISGICLTVILAIILASLGATGIIFNGSSKKEELRARPAVQSVTSPGTDVDVHEVQEVDSMDSSGQPKLASVVIPSAVREPKADEALQEWRRQHPVDGALDNPSIQSTRKPASIALAGLEMDSTLLSDGVPEAIDGALRIMNMDFQPALTDSKSWIFQYTSNDLTVYLNELFGKALNGGNYNATRIMSFRQGSVMVKYQSLWNQAPKNWDVSVSAILNKHLDLNNNFIGIFYTCRVDNGGCSHLCEFDLLEMRQYCLCPDHKSFQLINGTTCVRSGPAAEHEEISPSVTSTSVTSATSTPQSETSPVHFVERSTQLGPSVTDSFATAAPVQTGTNSTVIILATKPFAMALDTTLAKSTDDHVTVTSASATTTGATFTVSETVVHSEISALPALIEASSTTPIVSGTAHTADVGTSETTMAHVVNAHLIVTDMPTVLDVVIVHPNESAQAASTHVLLSTNSSATLVALPTDSNANMSIQNVTFFGIVPIGLDEHEGWTIPPNTSTTLMGTEQGTSTAPASVHVDSFAAHSPTTAAAYSTESSSTTPNTFSPSVTSAVVSATLAPVALTPSKTVCTVDEFFCQKEHRCVPHLVVCNGVPECQDGSDEANCTDCHPNFRCLSGACIPIGLVCDGMEDCNDGSDERACTQTVCQASGMFQCVIGYCLENANRCDGAGDCYAMGLPVDELNCVGMESNITCSDPNHFVCEQSRRCIPLSWKCNGRADCLNQEDEMNCQCEPGKISCSGGGGCIDARLHCNGVIDCPDGYSDEKDCFQLQNSGLVQARMSGNTWQNLCTDGWNQRAANHVCQQLGYRPATSVFTVPAPSGDTENVLWLKPDFNATRTLHQQLHITQPDTCSDPHSRAGITCQRFRCQIAADPSVGSQGKLQSAIVKIMFKEDAFTVCNGYLVAPMWILTSASCVQKRPADTMRLTFYTNTFHTNVTAVHFHPSHMAVRMLHNHDFALLKVANVVPANFMPICLPSNSNPSLCKLVKLHDNSTVAASQLQKVADMDCNSKRNYGGLVSPSMECWRSSLAMCDEDAVSPMICQSIFGSWEIRGFLSYQHHCGYFTQKPFVFANMTYAVDWIWDMIGPAMANIHTNESVFYPYMEPIAADSHVSLTTTHYETEATTTTVLTSTSTVTPTTAGPSTRMTVHYDLDEGTTEADASMNDNYNDSTPVSSSASGNSTTNSTAANFAAVLSNVFGNVSTAAANATAANITAPQPTAPTLKLQCPDATPLMMEYLCDGIFQCGDGWDEKKEVCQNFTCVASDHNRCSNGRCIERRSICDARAQCPNGASDEVGCEDCNVNTHFKCLEGRCIPLSWMCDGENDCQYGDDETSKKCTVCANATSQFRCESGGGCVSKEKVCDGAFDCPDFSDEYGCTRIVPFNGTTGNLVEIRSHGSDWSVVCESGIRNRESHWANGVCHDLGFDYMNKSQPVTVGQRAGFVLNRDATPNSNIYLASKNMTPECNGSEAMSVVCGLHKRGNWRFDIKDLDPAVAYEAAHNEYRHVVLLVFLKGDLDDCIGVILNSRWILTSYECVSQVNPAMAAVDWVLFSDPNSMDQGSFHMIRRFVAHPGVKFSVYFSKHDLLLVEAMDGLTIGSEANNNAAVWTAHRPVPANASCVSYGYLYSMVEIPGTRTSRKSEGKLYFWKTPLVSNEQCNQASNYNGMVSDSMLCGGFRNTTHRSPCMGRIDGAPVICQNSELLWEVVGIRSYQPVCESVWMAPSVYTDVYKHRKWIGDIIGPYLTMATTV